MNIDDLTIGQAQQLAALFPSSTNASTGPAPHPFVGRHVILRCSAAGVHAGYLASQVGDQAVLRNSRRLWSWKAAGGVALSGLAVHGLASGKLDTPLEEIAILGVCETIPTTAVAEASINAAPDL